MKIPEFKVGTTSTVQKKVTEEDTAMLYGNGALKKLLDTSTTAKLVIQAATKMIDPLLPEGLVSVGKSISIIHEEPAIIGMTVTVEAKLKEVDGNRLLFEFTLYDELGEIGRGLHERYIVKNELLENRAKSRLNILMGFN
ncbi:MAG: thioesterase family protein [Thermovenabulum sp.]|uniref:thioesterase family protein n=1 Tax=Thermovenabulum sp. TaxID=3100335 RepID=UPI003C7D2CBE